MFAENWASEWQADSTLRRARRYLQELEKRAGQCAPNSPERRQAEQHILELRASIQQQRLRRLGVLAPNESMPPATREP